MRYRFIVKVLILLNIFCLTGYPPRVKHASAPHGFPSEPRSPKLKGPVYHPLRPKPFVKKALFA